MKNAFEAGRDYALNGANTENCHFKWFATPELLAEWERGKASVAPRQSKTSKKPERQGMNNTSSKGRE